MPIRFGFDLRALEVFAQVAKSGNMSHAAEELGMTQSSISQTLANLEKALQTQLLDRSVRPMKLTSAGRFLQDRSAQILTEAQQTSEAIRLADFTELRHIKIALVDSIFTAVGSSLVESLKKRAQEWSISTGVSHLHGHALLSRNADIIISDDGLEDYPELIRHRILTEPFVLALPNTYNRPVVDLASLVNELDFIRYSAHSLIGRSIERHLRRARIEPQERLQLDNSYAIVSAVSAGLGWTITTPLCVFQSGIKLHQIQLRRLPIEPLTRSILLTARKGELGDLPQQIAQDSVDILRRVFLPALTEEQPWLEDQLKMGD